MTLGSKNAIGLIGVGLLFLSLQLAPNFGLPTIALDVASIESTTFPSSSEGGDLRCSSDYISFKIGWPLRLYEISGSSTCPTHTFDALALLVYLVFSFLMYKVYFVRTS